MMTRSPIPARSTSAASFAAVLALAGASPLSAQQHYTLSGPEAVVYNLAGRVEIVGGTGPDVEVTVERGGADAASLQVETGPLRGRSSLRVVYPSDRVYYGSRRGGNTSLRVREDGTFGEGGRRVVVGSRGGLDAHANLRIRVPDGRRLAVMLGVGEVRVENVAGDLAVDVAAAPVRVSGFRGALLIDTGSGGVDVRDVTGEVAIDTGSGAIDLAGVRGPRLRVDTGSGRVDGAGIDVDQLTIDTGSGGIGLTGVRTRELELDTGSGGIAVELASDLDRARIDTGSGSVRLTVPRALGAELAVETGSGGISIDGLAFEVETRRRNELRGVLGDGRGSIVVDTGSGSVRIVGR